MTGKVGTSTGSRAPAIKASADFRAQAQPEGSGRTPSPKAVAPKLSHPKAEATSPVALLQKGGADFVTGFRSGAQEAREKVQTVMQHLGGTPPELIIREKPIKTNGSPMETVGKTLSGAILGTLTLPLNPADKYLKERQSADEKGLSPDRAKDSANGAYWMGMAENATAVLSPKLAAAGSAMIEAGQQWARGERNPGRIIERAVTAGLSSYALDRAGDTLGDIIRKGPGRGPGGGQGLPDAHPAGVHAGSGADVSAADSAREPRRMTSDTPSGGGRKPFEGIGRGMSMDEAMDLASRERNLQGIPEEYLDTRKLEAFARTGGVDLKVGATEVLVERIARVGEKMFESAPDDVRRVISMMLEGEGRTRPGVEHFRSLSEMHDDPEIGPQLKEFMRTKFGAAEYEAATEFAVLKLAQENPAYRELSDLWDSMGPDGD